jgi:cytochrome c oxidase cbb3-type subunit 4
MAIENMLTDASSAMTVISLITFIGILWWAYSARRKTDFDEASRLPFADDNDVNAVSAQPTSEHHHG